MGANSRGIAVGLRQRNHVVERARSPSACRDGVAVEGRYQREFVSACSAIAVGETGAGLYELFPGLLGRSVLERPGILRGVRHGPYIRPNVGQAFDHPSNKCTNRGVVAGRLAACAGKVG